MQQLSYRFDQCSITQTFDIQPGNGIAVEVMPYVVDRMNLLLFDRVLAVIDKLHTGFDVMDSTRMDKRSRRHSCLLSRMGQRFGHDEIRVNQLYMSGSMIIKQLAA